MFTVVEKLPSSALHGDHVVVVDDDSESAMASEQQVREEELQVSDKYTACCSHAMMEVSTVCCSSQMMWQFVVGMLTNLESLPLERIHAMLLMFAQDSSAACSKEDLKQFLDKQVKDQALVFASGVYRLPPKNG